MADKRFFRYAEPLALEALVVKTGAHLLNEESAGLLISGVAPLAMAREGDVSFLTSKKYLSDFQKSKASACFIADEAFASKAPKNMAVLVVGNPQRAYAISSQNLIYDKIPPAGIGQNAVIDPSAKIFDDVHIGPGAIIGAEVSIGQSSVIGSGVVIGQGVQIGSTCRIGANVTLSHSLLGDRVVILPGTSIGQEGFGFASSAEGHLKIPQLGRVIIQDDIEIGANVTIDRGAAADTIIGAGTKIDNLVHIGHNCQIGRNCILVAYVGLSGSVILGDNVMLAGKVGVSDHVTIGANTQVVARSAVLSDLDGDGVYGGIPAKPVGDWRREVALMSRMVKESRKGGRRKK